MAVAVSVQVPSSLGAGAAQCVGTPMLGACERYA
jgi:hypothetical protein